MSIKTVDKLRNSESATVTELHCTGALRRRLIDMGITPGTVIVKRKNAPLGDPVQITVRGYELSIRKSEARLIYVR